MEEQLPLNKLEIGDIKYTYLDKMSRESETFEVEVVDQIPSPNLNPSLTWPNEPILF